MNKNYEKPIEAPEFETASIEKLKVLQTEIAEKLLKILDSRDEIY